MEEPERLYAANRKLRELQGGDASLETVLAALNVNDFSRPDCQAIFVAVERSLHEEGADVLGYLTSALPPELVAVVEELRRPTLESFQRRLSGLLMTELKSIQREQARINTLPEPDTSLFVEEALVLRHNRLARELQELYFLQEDVQENAQGDDLTERLYQAKVKAYTRARQLIAKALHQMRDLSREG